jgi:hypothetical protein
MLMQVERITRQEMWRRRYLSRPYLNDATDDQIADRLRYIIENSTTLTPNGQIGFLPPEPHGKYWLESTAHVMEAYRLRGGEPPANFLKDAMVPRPTHPSPPAIAKALEGIDLPASGSFLLKLGKSDHMRSLHEHGRLRIGPASGYSDPSLNAAIRDDELKLSAFGLRSEVKMEVIDHKTGKSKGAIEPIGNVIYTTASKTDFYVYCMGSSLDLRLFGDFGYDACVIFRDPQNFKTRLHAEMQKRFPDWQRFDQPVHYLDPFNCTKQEMNVLVSKHHRYWYQHEFRFGWVPPAVTEPPLPELFLELGDMRSNSIFVAIPN